MYFEKISLEQWTKDCLILGMSNEDIIAAYDNIKLPKSSTASAAGHDFYIPFEVKVSDEHKTVIPTGIRWVTEEDENNMVLIICPRSGLGTKYGMRLANTIGIIDADYFQANNEGHIMAIVNTDFNFTLQPGDRFMQGIIVPFVHCGEKINTTRTGGFGSTGN